MTTRKFKTPIESGITSISNYIKKVQSELNTQFKIKKTLDQQNYNYFHGQYNTLLLLNDDVLDRSSTVCCVFISTNLQFQKTHTWFLSELERRVKTLENLQKIAKYNLSAKDKKYIDCYKYAKVSTDYLKSKLHDIYEALKKCNADFEKFGQNGQKVFPAVSITKNNKKTHRSFITVCTELYRQFNEVFDRHSCFVDTFGAFFKHIDEFMHKNYKDVVINESSKSFESFEAFEYVKMFLAFKKEYVKIHHWNDYLHKNDYNVSTECFSISDENFKTTKCPQELKKIYDLYNQQYKSIFVYGQLANIDLDLFEAEFMKHCTFYNFII